MASGTRLSATHMPAKGALFSMPAAAAAIAGNPVRCRRWTRQAAMPLSISACYCRHADGTLEPALVFEHNAAGLPTARARRSSESTTPLRTKGTVSVNAVVSEVVEAAPPPQAVHRHLSSLLSQGYSDSPPGLPSSQIKQFSQPLSPKPPPRRVVSLAAIGPTSTMTAAVDGSSLPKRMGSLLGTRGGATALSSAGGGAQSPDMMDMMRGLAALSHCAMVTLLDLDGSVLYQNSASKKYWGSIGPLPLATARRRSIAPISSDQVCHILVIMHLIGAPKA